MGNKKNILLFSLVVILIVVSMVVGKKKKEIRYHLLSKDCIEIVACVKNKGVQIHVGPYLNVVYKIANRELTAPIYVNFSFLEKGDTILIKYSVEDPTVIEVVDPCYMQKHKGKPYCK